MTGEIQQVDTWLGRYMENMGEAELISVFKEISEFRRTGFLKGEQLRNLAREFSDNVTHTDYGQNMRLIEDEVLFEMSRRYYNSTLFNCMRMVWWSRRAMYMAKNKLHSMCIKTDGGVTLFSIQRQADGKFHFQMDSCEAILSKSDLKQLISEIRGAILE